MIRAFKGQDLEQVMEIWLEMNKEAHAFINSEYWEENYAMVKGLLGEAEKHGITLFVEVKEEEIRGFIGLSGSQIEGLFVKKGFWSQGIGQALMNEAKAHSNELTLHVYEKNERALAFYKKEGFTVQSRQQDEMTGEVELVMAYRMSINHKG